MIDGIWAAYIFSNNLNKYFANEFNNFIDICEILLLLRLSIANRLFDEQSKQLFSTAAINVYNSEVVNSANWLMFIIYKEYFKSACIRNKI